MILRAKSLGLGEIEAFPFLDPPSPRAIADGYALLHELGAVDEKRELTGDRTGAGAAAARPARGAHAGRGARRRLPRAGPVIAAALSVQDPRERPLERAAAADEKHARFADESSDFLAYLKLWKVFEGKLEEDLPREFPLDSRACANGATSTSS